MCDTSSSLPLQREREGARRRKSRGGSAFMNAKRIASFLTLWACSVDSFAPIRSPSRCLSSTATVSSTFPSSTSSERFRFQTELNLSHLSHSADLALVSSSLTILIGYHANLYKKVSHIVYLLLPSHRAHLALVSRPLCIERR